MKIEAIALLVLTFAVLPALAETGAPSTEQMIQQLKAPRMRNLVVNEVAEAKAPTVRASLTMLIQFGFNSAKVLPESESALAGLSVALQSAELVAAKFAVEGHTDAKGHSEVNRKLSLQRALAVRDFLRDKGVDEERLVVVGKGASELALNDQPFAAQNRRVRIVNLD